MAVATNDLREEGEWQGRREGSRKGRGREAEREEHMSAVVNILGSSSPSPTPQHAVQPASAQ